MTQYNDLLNIAGLKQESLIDGIGLRTVIYFQGCSHQCIECQNPHTWNFSNKNLISIKYIINYIINDSLSNGVTLSGGCPMCQQEYFDTMIKLLKQIRSIGKDIWCYCGETLEKLSEQQKILLQYIDVLIDGKFMIEKRNDTLAFRGSSNQRIIDVKESIKQNKTVLYKIN